MAEVRVEEVHITLDRREAQGLIDVLNMLGSRAEGYRLGSLQVALMRHNIYPSEETYSRYFTLDHC